jgi:hypothetical protein
MHIMALSLCSCSSLVCTLPVSSTTFLSRMFVVWLSATMRARSSLSAWSSS